MNARHFTAQLTAPIYSAVQLERKNKLIWHLRPPPLWIMYHQTASLLKPPFYDSQFSTIKAFLHLYWRMNHWFFISISYVLPFISCYYYIHLKPAFIHCLPLKCNRKCPSVKMKKERQIGRVLRTQINWSTHLKKNKKSSWKLKGSIRFMVQPLSLCSLHTV